MTALYTLSDGSCSCCGEALGEHTEDERAGCIRALEMEEDDAYEQRCRDLAAEAAWDRQQAERAT